MTLACVILLLQGLSEIRDFFVKVDYGQFRSCKCLFAGAVNTLSIVEERYFKPSPSAFLKVAGRGPDAWQFRPGSYFLLPFQEAFGRKIPGDFTIFLSIKPTQESEVYPIAFYIIKETLSKPLQCSLV